MATYSTTFLRNKQQRLGVWGNTTSIEPATYETNSSGVALNTTATTATQANDVIVLDVLPAGLRIDDVLAIQSTAASASTTADIGFAYVDGVDDAAVPQNAAQFFSALATSSTGRTRQTTANAPVTLPKDAYLTLTRKGAADAKASKLTVIVSGVWIGSK